MDGSDAEVGDRGHRPGVGGHSVLHVYSVFLAFLAGMSTVQCRPLQLALPPVFLGIKLQKAMLANFVHAVSMKSKEVAWKAKPDVVV